MREPSLALHGVCSDYLAPPALALAWPALARALSSRSFLLCLVLSRRTAPSNTPYNAALTQSIFVKTDHLGTRLPLVRGVHELIMIGSEIIM